MDSTTYDDETVVRVDETTAMMAVHLPRIQNLAVGVPVWRSGRGSRDNPAQGCVFVQLWATEEWAYIWIWGRVLGDEK